MTFLTHHIENLYSQLSTLVSQTVLRNEPKMFLSSLDLF
jgi:hypothetical protein